MQAKERVLTALNWQEPDRVPIQIYLTPEMKTKLSSHFKGRDILECLGVDFRSVGPVYRGKSRESHNDIACDMWELALNVLSMAVRELMMKQSFYLLPV